jgi:hypothetical protein
VVRYPGNSSDYLNVSGKTTFGGHLEANDWNGTAWQAAYSSRSHVKEASDDLIQMDKSAMPAAVAWLRQMPMKIASHADNRVWIEQRIVGKDWPDQFLAWLDRRPRDVTVVLDKELASLKDGRVAGQVRLDVEESKTGMDWFDLSVALQVTDTTLSTDEIALLLKSKGKWVKLQNKGWRKLEFDLTEAQLKELADLELAVNDFDGTQKQTVFAYRLIIKDSIEEKIRQLQKKKGDIANDILGEENFAEALTLNDFNFLLDGN